MTFDDMREHVRQSNLIEGITDPQEVDASLAVWARLLQEKELTHPIIKAAQSAITASQPLRPDQRGTYRDVSRTNVWVGAYRPPSWPDISGLMDDWLDGYEGRTPWENHVYFEGIHPFADGNGRTGRMLMWWQEVKEGGQPTLFPASERWSYYRKLDTDRKLQAAERLERQRF